MLQKVLTGFLAVVILLVFSGCSIGTDVETLLRAPKTTGEQLAIEEALEAYINKTKKNEALNTTVDYILKYPESGDYRSAFIIKDLNNDGVDEAIGFYRYGTENSNVHINLLQIVDSQWVSVSDIEGFSTDVEQVYFGDFNGDGLTEILAGWNIDNVRDRQLVLYSISGGKFSECYKWLYSDVVIGDLTGCGHDNLLVLYANTTDHKTTAQLWTMQGDASEKQDVTEVSTTPLDGYIQEFGSSVIGTLSDSLVGVYIDGIKSTGMVTELIYWDGKQLRSPFYNSINNITECTYRESDIPCMDVDGDGAVEWPYTSLPAGYESTDTEESLWKTEWRSWNYSKQVVETEFNCILNKADGYYLRLDDAWDGQVTATLDNTTHTLHLYQLDNGEVTQELLALRTVYLSETASSSDLTSESNTGVHTYTRLDKLTDMYYEVWYSTIEPYNFNMESVRYMFSRITID